MYVTYVIHADPKKVKDRLPKDAIVLYEHPHYLIFGSEVEWDTLRKDFKDEGLVGINEQAEYKEQLKNELAKRNAVGKAAGGK